MLKIKTFSARSYDEQFLSAAAQEAGGVQFDFTSAALSSATLEAARGFEGLCLFVNDALTSGDVASLHKDGLRLVLLRCAGSDGVDVAACAAAGVRVLRVPTYSPEAVAEFAMASLLTLVRKTHRANNRVRVHNFALEGLMGFNIRGKSIGLIGTGAIGQCFARIVAGFGPSEIVAFDVAPSDELRLQVPLLRYVPLEEVAARADVVSLHVPLLPSTKHLVSAKLLALMKPEAVLVNTSRGALVDTAVLVAALKEGKLGGYCGDVYEFEKDLFFSDRSEQVLDDDLFTSLAHMPNVLLTAHCAFFTDEAMRQIAATCLDNVRAYRTHQPPGRNDIVKK